MIAEQIPAGTAILTTLIVAFSFAASVWLVVSWNLHRSGTSWAELRRAAKGGSQ